MTVGAAGATAESLAASGVGAASAPVEADATPSARPAREPHAHRIPSAVPASRVVADSPMGAPGPGGPSPGGSRVVTAPAREGFGSRIARTPVAIGLAVLALALVIGGVGAYVFLPTATAVIAPKEAAIGPIPLRITADPAATEPDPEGRTVPAMTKDVPVETTDSFAVTGKRVEEKPATGTVRFRNKDFTSTNTIPRGSVVGTQNGIRFRTDRSITVPAAQLVGLQIFPASATVKVTAVDRRARGQRPAEHDPGDPAWRGSSDPGRDEPGCHERRQARRVPARRPGRHQRRDEGARRQARLGLRRTGRRPVARRPTARRSSRRRRHWATRPSASTRRRSSARRSRPSSSVRARRAPSLPSTRRPCSRSRRPTSGRRSRRATSWSRARAISNHRLVSSRTASSRSRSRSRRGRSSRSIPRRSRRRSGGRAAQGREGDLGYLRPVAVVRVARLGRHDPDAGPRVDVRMAEPVEP